MKKEFAIFDVDYTLVKGDSMFLILLFGIRKKPWIIFYTPIIFIKMVLYSMKIIDVKEAKEAIYFPLKYLNEIELKEFYGTVLQKKIFKEVFEILKNHKEKGRHVLLVSASPEAYLNLFKENDYIDGVIGTKLKLLGDKFTNKIQGENCKGEEKVRRIREYLRDNNLEIDYKNSFAYSDSLSDKPMLCLVNNRFRVDKKNGNVCEFNI